jgi:membrane-associated phospholipid phosphatase
MRRAARAVLALALLWASPRAARAAPNELRHDLHTDAWIAGGGWALYLASELAKGTVSPSRCRFCGTNAFDAGARDLLVWGHIDRARLVSDLSAYALVPAGMIAHQLLAARGAGDVEAGFVDVLIVAEAAAIAMDLNELVKLLVARQRPFVHYGDYRDPDRKPGPDDNMSFYGGHTTFAFVVAAAAGTVSDLRGYESAPWVWGIGLTVAATTGYLRIAADQHYLTDVLVGAGMGLAAGIALPRLLHGRKDGGTGGTAASVSITPFPLGVAFVF